MTAVMICSIVPPEQIMTGGPGRYHRVTTNMLQLAWLMTTTMLMLASQCIDIVACSFVVGAGQRHAAHEGQDALHLFLRGTTRRQLELSCPRLDVVWPTRGLLALALGLLALKLLDGLRPARRQELRRLRCLLELYTLSGRADRLGLLLFFGRGFLLTRSLTVGGRDRVGGRNVVLAHVAVGCVSQRTVPVRARLQVPAPRLCLVGEDAPLNPASCAVLG